MINLPGRQRGGHGNALALVVVLLGLMLALPMLLSGRTLAAWFTGAAGFAIGGAISRKTEEQ